MIDNRRLPPPGSSIAKSEDGREVVISYLTIPNKGRIMYGCLLQEEKTKVLSGEIPCQLAFVEDFFLFKPVVEACSRMYEQHQLYPTFEYNRGINESRVSAEYNFDPIDTVILCGAGPSLDADVVNEYRMHENTKVVTLGNAQGEVVGDYFVHLDAIDSQQRKEFLSVQDSMAHLCVVSDPGMADLGWKQKTWFTVDHLPNKAGLVSYQPTENVTCAAIQFVCKFLQPSKIVMVGMDHPIIIGDSNTYFWHGIDLQAYCYFACKHGVEVWNCTPTSSVICGVVVGSMKQAFAEGGSWGTLQ